MKIVTVSDARGRDESKTRSHLNKLGIPFATAPIPHTVMVTMGDQTQAWDGYQPWKIRKYCPLRPVEA